MKSRFTHSRLFISILIALILSIIIPLTAQAASGSMTDEDGQGSGAIVGGPSSQKNGWLFYAIDAKTNTQITSTVVWLTSPLVDRNGKEIPLTNVNLISRYGVRAVGWTIGTPWNFGPFDVNGNGKGSDLKKFLLEDYSPGIKNAHYLIYNQTGSGWGEELAQRWSRREVYLVFEDVAWHHIYKDGLGTGIWYCSTAYEWGKLQQAFGLPEYGDRKISSYTNGVYAFCVKLEDAAEIRSLGYIAPGPGKKTNAEMATINLGCGIGMVWNDTNAIHSYDQSNGSPGAPQSSSPPLNGTSNIIKCYYEENITTGIKTDLGTYKTLECTNNIYIDDEPSFEIERWVISSSTNPSITSLAFNPPSTILRQGITSQEVTLGGIEKTVYILLKRVKEETPTQLDYNYNLSQSSITRRVRLSNPDNQLTLPKVQNHIFTWTSSAHQTECTTHNCGGCYCDGHSHRSSCKDSCTSSHRCSGCKCSGHQCSNWRWKSQTLKFSLQNTHQSSHPDVLASKNGTWVETNTGSSLSKRYETWDRTVTGANNRNTSNWDYVCVIHRGKDKLTVPSYINSSLGTDAPSNLESISASGYTINDGDAGTRKTSDYFDTFNVTLDEQVYKNTTQYGPTTDSGHGICGVSERLTWLSTPLTLNNIVVKIETYSGTKGSTVNDLTCDSSEMLTLPMSGYNTSSGRMTKSGGTVSFRPFIEMKYDMLGLIDLKAYVLAEHQRAITPNDYAEISWNKKTSDPNLTINSLNWSTHAQAVSDFGTSSVLPGGAPLSLAIKESDRQDVLISTYQTIITGAAKTQIEKSGGEIGGLEESSAVTSHQSYVNSVITSLDSTNVQQYVESDKNKSSGFSGLKVDSGTTLTGLASKQASNEDKYYFREDGFSNAASEGDLDVKEEGTTTKLYTFFTNTKGELRMVVDDPNAPLSNQSAGELICGKDATASSYSVSNSTAKMIDSRTYAIKKLLQAVERNTGNDAKAKNVGDGHWYNEAFNGITVIVQYTHITVGYVDPTERTSILDPRLCPKSSGQSNMFKEYYLSQFKTKEFSQAYGDKYTVGSFKDINVKMNNMDMLFWSKKFYIPNVTTQDLH